MYWVKIIYLVWCIIYATLFDVGLAGDYDLLPKLRMRNQICLANKSVNSPSLMRFVRIAFDFPGFLTEERGKLMKNGLLVMGY